MPTFASRAVTFHTQLDLQLPASLNVEVLNPFTDENTVQGIRSFYKRFYTDNEKRVGIFGINPGRFGAGLSGISFTDPVALRKHCGIPNTLGDRVELSSSFVYRCIDQFGGVDTFFRSFYLSATCPLGFTRGRVNFNFYDSAELLRATTPFVVSSFEKQLRFPLRRDLAICLGRGKLYTFLQVLNLEHGWFEKIIALDHPRFIMQYRRKRLQEYVDEYTRCFESCLITPHPITS